MNYWLQLALHVVATFGPMWWFLGRHDRTDRRLFHEAMHEARTSWNPDHLPASDRFRAHSNRTLRATGYAVLVIVVLNTILFTIT